MIRIAASVLALLLLIPGCACPPLPEVRELPGQSLATPEAALEYFREALLQGKTYHEYRVFSEEMKERVEAQEDAALTVANYSLVRDDVRAELEARVGDLEDVEIGDARFLPGRDDRAWVELESVRAPEPTRVEMVRETGYSVWFTDPTRPPAHVILRGTDGDPLSIENRAAVLRIALPDDVDPANAEGEIYRIGYAREWKIAWVHLPRFLSGVGEKARAGLEAPAPPPAP